MAAAIEEALVVILAAAAGATGIPATRLFPDFAPEGAAMPLLVYQQVGRSAEPAINEAASLTESRWQVTIWAATRAAARTAADAVRAALDNYAGAPGGVTVCRIFWQGESSDVDPGAGSNVGISYGVRQDYAVWTQE